MVCAGWRTDCENLARYIRSIDKKERITFGNQLRNEQEHGSFLASQASMILAKSRVSETRRRLSCLGLMASGEKLWMIDSTGAYRVRAHSVGAKEDQVNSILKRTDSWTTRDCDDVAAELLRILFNLKPGASNTVAKVPNGSLVEMVCVAADKTMERKLRRLFVSNLFDSHELVSKL